MSVHITGVISSGGDFCLRQQISIFPGVILSGGDYSGVIPTPTHVSHVHRPPVSVSSG